MTLAGIVAVSQDHPGEGGFRDWYCAQNNFVNQQCSKPPIAIIHERE